MIAMREKNREQLLKVWSREITMLHSLRSPETNVSDDHTECYSPGVKEPPFLGHASLVTLISADW